MLMEPARRVHSFENRTFNLTNTCRKRQYREQKFQFKKK